MDKNWQIKNPISQDFANQFPEINPIVLQLLANRNITTQKQIDEFLNPDYGDDTHDPFLFGDMQKAVERILSAIEKQEKIIIYGDYDADGVCSSAIVFSLINALGGKVGIYIPFRETEGYGLNIAAVEQVAKDGAKLVVTVDCAISNVLEVAKLNELGVDVVITDHHSEPLELPKAFAIINPHLKNEKYPFKDLAGCGVAYKLAQAVVKKHKDFKVNQLPESWEKWLLDLVAIGTIADVMDLIGENRTLVKYGLIVAQKTKRLGLKKLVELTGNQLEDLNEFIVSWQITPRLNAAGRLNHASTAYRLLITEDEKEADNLAEELNQTNKDRQKITDTIYNDAKTILGEVKAQKIIIVCGKDWPLGIIGLVAGRLKDEFSRPAVIISQDKGKIVGSARSIEKFNIIEAIRKCDKFLDHYGGHSGAAGFTIKNQESLDNFINQITDIAENQIQEADLQPTIEIDAEVKLEEVNWELFEDLEKFQPYGEANLRPKFLARNLNVNEFQTVGPDGKHLRLMVSHKTPIVRKTIGFCFGDWCTKIKRGDKIDMVFEVDANEWNGNRELQLKIVDLKMV